MHFWGFQTNGDFVNSWDQCSFIFNYLGLFLFTADIVARFGDLAPIWRFLAFPWRQKFSLATGDFLAILGVLDSYYIKTTFFIIFQGSSNFIQKLLKIKVKENVIYKEIGSFFFKISRHELATFWHAEKTWRQKWRFWGKSLATRAISHLGTLPQSNSIKS